MRKIWRFLRSFDWTNGLFVGNFRLLLLRGVRVTTICLFFHHWLRGVYGTFFASQFQLVPRAFD